MIGCGQSKGGSRKGGNAMKKQKAISGTGGPVKKISLGEEIRKNRTDGENIHRTIKRTADILNRIPHI